MDELELQVAETLAEQARRTEAPLVDAVALLAVGRKEVRRRRVRAGSLAALGVVVAIAAAGGISLATSSTDDGRPAPIVGTPTPTHTTPPAIKHPPPPPSRLADLAVGNAPELPYWSDGWLYVGSRRIRMTLPYALVGNNATTLVLPQRTPGTVSLLSSTGLVKLSGHGDVPSVSPDGRYAVWEVPSGSQVKVALWNLAQRHRLATFTTPYVHAQCCGGGDPTYPMAVDNVGRVYFQGPGITVWDHRTGVLRKVSQVPHGVTVYGGRPRIWSSDGRRALVGIESERPWVYDETTGRTVKLDLPRDARAQPLGAWESPTSVLIPVASTHYRGYPANAPGAILRCDATTGTCDIAAHLDREENTRLPGPSWWLN